MDANIAASQTTHTQTDSDTMAAPNLRAVGVPMVAALIVVVLSLVPEQEPALYLTTVVLGLFVAALSLLWLVFGHRRAAAGNDHLSWPHLGRQ